LLVLDSPLASNLGTGVSSYLLAKSIEKGLTAYHRAAFRFELETLTDTCLRREVISELAEQVIETSGMAGGAARFLMGRGFFRDKFFGTGRRLYQKALALNSRWVEDEVVVGYAARRWYELPGGRLAGRLAHSWGKYAFDFGIGLAVDIGVQWWLDKDDPYLTGNQVRGRLIVEGVGSGVGFLAGAGAELVAIKAGASAVGILGGPAGWVGLGVGIFVAIVWDVGIEPLIYEAKGLNPERNLAPLGD
jgi:hypothetical protein